MIDFIKSNPFIFSVGVLQLFGSCQYLHRGRVWFGLLYVLYGFTNFIIMAAEREGAL